MLCSVCREDELDSIVYHCFVFWSPLDLWDMVLELFDLGIGYIEFFLQLVAWRYTLFGFLLVSSEEWLHLVSDDTLLLFELGEVIVELLECRSKTDDI